MSHLEEEMLSLDEKISYSDLTKGERNDLYLLYNNSSKIIKQADKGSVMVVMGYYIRKQKLIRKFLSQKL